MDTPGKWIRNSFQILSLRRHSLDQVHIGPGHRRRPTLCPGILESASQWYLTSPDPLVISPIRKTVSPDFWSFFATASAKLGRTTRQ